MIEEFDTPDDGEPGDEPVASDDRWSGYILPALALAVLVVVVVAGYALYLSSRGAELMAAARPTQIAFMSDRDGNWEIYIMDRDGLNALNLTNNPARDGLPMHASGQESLIFASDGDGPTLDVWSINLDGSNPTNITQTSDSNEVPIAWSPDGEHVVFASDQSGTPEIILAEPSSGTTINLSERYRTQSFDDWLGEMDQFILTTASDFGTSLLVADLAGDTNLAVTDGSYPAGAGKWSPDGTHIAYMGVEPGSNAIDIFVVEVAAGEPVNLTQSMSNDSFPQWSPDGSKIAFVSDRDGNSEIYVMDSDGSAQTNLTNHPADESIQGDFSWSPSGDQILFHSDRDNNVEVYVMDADGNNQTNLTNSPGTDYFAVWVE
jgi:Tol biopolymer transport system component